MSESIRVSIEDATHTLHPQWVRERCLCEEVETGQAKADLSSKERNTVSVLARAVEEDGTTLTVTFGDGHRVRLCKNRIGSEITGFGAHGAAQCKSVPLPLRRLWTAATFRLSTFEHASLFLHSERSCAPDVWVGVCKKRAELLHALLETGVVLLRGVPCESGEILRVARELVGNTRETHWGALFNVESKPAPPNGNDAVQGDGEDAFDLAYTGHSIPFHVDNPYREPPLDFQLLHCLRFHDASPDASANDRDGMNQLVDAVKCAVDLRTTDPAAYEALSSTCVKWENDRPLCRLAPIIEEDPASGEVRRVYWSPKSGGYAPPQDVAELQTFYDAKRKLCALFEMPENIVELKLSPGDLLIFGNTRVLHARSEFDATKISRHLQGCYIDIDAVTSSLWRYRDVAGRGARPLVMGTVNGTANGTARPTWTSLKDCTKPDVDRMVAAYNEETRSNQAQRVLQMLRSQRGASYELGAPVDLYTHGLQAATLAFRAGEDEDMVVGALLHDIGELLSPSNHGDVCAAILEPYVRPSMTWVLRHHEIFQMKYYAEHCGGNPDGRDRFRSSEHFDECEKFCRDYDQAAFNAEMEPLPLSFFEPMVRAVFARAPFWHSPEHPKRGAVVSADGNT